DEGVERSAEYSSWATSSLELQRSAVTFSWSGSRPTENADALFYAVCHLEASHGEWIPTLGCDSAFSGSNGRQCLGGVLGFEDRDIRTIARGELESHTMHVRDRHVCRYLCTYVCTYMLQRELASALQSGSAAD